MVSGGPYSASAAAFLNEIYEVVPCSGSIAKTGRRISVSCRGFLIVHSLAHCMFRTALVENTEDHGLIVVFHMFVLAPIIPSLGVFFIVGFCFYKETKIHPLQFCPQWALW